MSKQVSLHAPFRLPNKCCVCRNDASTTTLIKRTEYIPLLVVVSVTTKEFPIPFCDECLRKANRKAKHYNNLMVFWFFAMIFFGSVACLCEKIPVLIAVSMLLATGSLGMAIYCGSLERRRFPVRLKRLTNTEVVLECENIPFADDLAGHENARSALQPNSSVKD